MIADKQRLSAMNSIVVTQCLGMLGGNLFANGVLLSYCALLGMDSARIALLFALPSLVGMLLKIPFAFCADFIGKRRFSLWGQVIIFAGLALLAVSAGVPSGRADVILSSGIFLIAFGGTMQGSCWFSLLSPIIPPRERGKFFGRLRVTFQTVSVIFTLGVSRLLDFSAGLTMYSTILSFVAAAGLVRYFFYRRIPELERTAGTKIPGLRGGLHALREIVELPGFMGYQCYLFLLLLVSASVPMVFGLMGKDVLGFGASQLTLMGTLLIAGQIGGCYLGGRMVDCYGTKNVFVFGHLAFVAVLFGVCFRSMFPVPVIWVMGIGTTLFSVVSACVGIATTSEMFGLLPQKNKSLATATFTSFNDGAMMLSALLVSQTLEFKVLSARWEMAGMTLTQYDTILLFFGTSLLLFLVTLGLIPSVICKAEILPMNGLR